MNFTLKISFPAIVIALALSQSSSATPTNPDVKKEATYDALHMPGIWATGVINNDTNNIYALTTVSPGLNLDKLHYQYNEQSLSVAQTISDSATMGLLVLHGNKILYEAYFSDAIDKESTVDKDPGGDIKKTLFPSYSVGKSITSSAIGLAVQAKDIASIDEPMEKYAPILKKSAYNGVSIRNVLNMSSGVYFNEGYTPGAGISDMLIYLTWPWNTIDGFISKQTKRIDDFAPGDYYNYSSLDSAALATVVRGATGQKMVSWLQNNLWKKAGMESFARVQIDNAGLELGFCCIKATLRDYGRYGLIYANDGVLNGHQILPKAWIDMSTKPVNYPKGALEERGSVMGYGNQWWIPKDQAGDFMAVGLFGQFVYVDPAHNIVIVKTSNDVVGYPKNKLYVDQMMALFRSIRDEVITNS